MVKIFNTFMPKKKTKKFLLEIELKGDCKTPADIGYVLGEISERLTYITRWPTKPCQIAGDTESENSNGAWKIE